MNICKSEKEYLDQIIEPARRCCKRYGYLPSVLIAQSCLENGYGIPAYWDNPQIQALMTYNNMVGIKVELLSKSWTDCGLSVWPGKSLEKKTPEVYNGIHVTIDDSFRKYDTIEQSFADFLCFMTWGSNYGKGGTPKYGQKVLGIKDPKTLIKTVAGLGYATDPSYPDKVMDIVKKHNLTQYDDLTGVEPTKYVPAAANKEEEVPKVVAKKYTSVKEALAVLGVTLIDRIAQNRGQVPAHNANSHEFFGEHYLGVNGNNPDLYGGGYGGHYYIDRQGKCYQAALPTDKLWHVGASSGFVYIHPTARNHNTVGVECATYTASGRDNDNETWYFTEATQVTSAKLAAAFLTVYGLSIDKLLRHGDVTTKNCPSPHKRDQGKGTNWTWARYKTEVQKYMDQLAGKAREVLRKGSQGEAVLKLQKDLDALGYFNIKQNAEGKWYEEHLKKDGDFGTNTEEQVSLFQKREGLKCTGIADLTTLDQIDKRLEEMAGANSDEDFKPEDLTKTIGTIIAEAKKEAWAYGNSHVYPPCADNTISCDRLISLALYRHGIRHQPYGGFAGGNLEKALLDMGWLKAEDPEKVTGSAVVVMYKNGEFHHAYWQVSYAPQTGLCTKYDAGDDWRWKEASQPFKGVKRNEWTDGREVGAVYTMPEPDKTMELIRAGQQKSIEFTGHRIAVDGIFGTETKEQCIRVIQRAANIDYQAHLKEDGDRGPQTDAVMAGHFVEYDETQYMVTAVEIIAMMLGKDPGGVEMPGHYGDGLAKAIGKKKITYAQLVSMIESMK